MSRHSLPRQSEPAISGGTSRSFGEREEYALAPVRPCNYCGKRGHPSFRCYDPHIDCGTVCNVPDTHHYYHPCTRCRASTLYDRSVIRSTHLAQQALREPPPGSERNCREQSTRLTQELRTWSWSWPKRGTTRVRGDPDSDEGEGSSHRSAPQREKCGPEHGLLGPGKKSQLRETAYAACTLQGRGRTDLGQHRVCRPIPSLA
jgi:hypothetical protein